MRRIAHRSVRCALLVVLAFCPEACAQDDAPRISLDVTDATVGSQVELLRASYGVSVSVTPEAARARVTVAIRDMTPAEAVRAIAAAAGLSVSEVDGELRLCVAAAAGSTESSPTQVGPEGVPQGPPNAPLEERRYDLGGVEVVEALMGNGDTVNEGLISPWATYWAIWAGATLLVNGKPYFEARSWTVGPMFSPDGDHIAIAADLEGEWYVLVGRQRYRAYDGLWHDHWRFSADSGHVACVAKRGNTGVLVCDGDEKCNFPLQGLVPPAHISPDGQRVFCFAERDGLRYPVLDGRPLPQFTEAFNPVFSPNGQRLAFQVQQGDVRYLVLDEVPGPTTPWTGGAGILPPVFSPDGRDVAYLISSGVMSGKQYHVIVDRSLLPRFSAHSLHGPIFSPDGKTVACLAGVIKDYNVYLNGSKQFELKGVWPIEQVCFSRDATELLCAGLIGYGRGVAALGPDGIRVWKLPGNAGHHRLFAYGEHLAWGADVDGEGRQMWLDGLPCGRPYSVKWDPFERCWLSDERFVYVAADWNKVQGYGRIYYRITAEPPARHTWRERLSLVASPDGNPYPPGHEARADQN